jgi:hypothetical protein
MGGPQYYFAGSSTGFYAPPTVLGRGGFEPLAPEDPVQILTGLDDVRAATRRAIGSAKRLLSIFTSHLEPPLYEHQPILDQVQKFLLSHSFAKVRILSQIPTFHNSTHRLMDMKRRLSGHVELRALNAEFKTRRSGYLIADTRAIVYRSQVATWEGVAGFDQPPIAQLYLREFDEMWIASERKY